MLTLYPSSILTKPESSNKEIISFIQKRLPQTLSNLDISVSLIKFDWINNIPVEADQYNELLNHTPTRKIVMSRTSLSALGGLVQAFFSTWFKIASPEHYQFRDVDSATVKHSIKEILSSRIKTEEEKKERNTAINVIIYFHKARLGGKNSFSPLENARLQWATAFLDNEEKEAAKTLAALSYEEEQFLISLAKNSPKSEQEKLEEAFKAREGLTAPLMNAGGQTLTLQEEQLRVQAERTIQEFKTLVIGEAEARVSEAETDEKIDQNAMQKIVNDYDDFNVRIRQASKLFAAKIISAERKSQLDKEMEAIYANCQTIIYYVSLKKDEKEEHPSHLALETNQYVVHAYHGGKVMSALNPFVFSLLALFTTKTIRNA